MAVDNENAIVNTPATTSETPSNLVAEGKGNELSPNPAGFGFTKQLFVDSLPVSGQDKTLYLVKHGSGYLKYKWNLAERKFERVFDPLPIKLDEGEHKVATDERVAPKVAPEKVFNGLVVFLGDVKGLEKTTFGKSIINAIGKVGDEKIKQNEATNTTEITNNVEIQGFLKLNGDLIGFDIPIVLTDPTSEPATADSPTFVSYNGIIFANVNGEYVSFSAGQIEDGSITKAKFAAGAFDNELNEESTNAVQNKVLFLALEDVAKVNGNYQTMTVGLANNLVATNGLTTTNSFIMELTGGDQASAVSTGNMNLTLRGNSVVVNQGLQNPTFTSSSNWSAENENVTLSIADGEATVTNTVANYGIKQSIANKINKTCIAIFTAKSSDLTSLHTIIGNSGKSVNISQNYQTFYVLLTPTTNASAFYLFSRTETGTFVVKEAYLIDLTQWFNGDIPQDILDNPENFINYYQGSLAYDTGHIENAQSTSLIGRGINQWDEIAEVGSINNSGENTSGSYLRSKNYIRVIPNKQYYFNRPSNLLFYIYCYDVNKNFVPLDEGENHLPYKTLTQNNFLYRIPNNVVYIRFVLATQYGTTYNHDVCINISNPDINGNYFPSEVNETALGNDVLKSAGDFYDSKAPNGLIERKAGTVVYDGSSDENWGIYGSNQRMFINNGLVKSFANDVNSKIVCNRLVSSTKNQLASSDYAISTADEGGHGFIIRIDSSIDTVEKLRTWLSNNPLTIQFPLEEPTTEQGTPFAESIKVVKGGTLEFVGNGIPQGNSMFFQKNLKSFLEAFGTAINYDPSRIERLANLSFTPETADIVLNPSPANAYAKVQVMSSTFTIVVSAALTGTASGTITFQDSEVDLTNFQTKPAEAIYDMDGKKVSEAPTTTDCNIASFVGRSYNGVILWSILHSGVNKIKIHFEQAVPLDENGNGKVDCRASLIL